MARRRIRGGAEFRPDGLHPAYPSGAVKAPILPGDNEELKPGGARRHQRAKRF